MQPELSPELVAGCPAATIAAQAPLVRTVYRRTAFQESSNNQVRAACRLATPIRSATAWHGSRTQLNLLYSNVPQGSQLHLFLTPSLPTLPQVRISLDSELHMVREEAAPHAPGDWCRYARGAPLGNSALVKKYPYSKSRRFSPSAPPKHCSGLGHI